MRKVLIILVGLFLATGGSLFAIQVTGSEAQAEDGDKILEFETMVGVPRPFTGGANAIRGVNGGGLPWAIADAKGELRDNGDIEIEVEGLVLDPNDQAVIDRGLAGINPVAEFKAIVSCMSIDDNGDAVIVNVETDLFPADTKGNSEIEDNVTLPIPCIAPIVFVTSPGGSWFSATGFWELKGDSHRRTPYERRSR